VRFEAALPNERWQSDVTHWRLVGGTQVDILNFLDDHSRLVVASEAMSVVRAPDVLRVFTEAAEVWDSRHRCSRTTVRLHGLAPGRRQHRRGRAARPRDRLSPLTTVPPSNVRQGRTLHQTLKAYLANQQAADTLEMLQAQIDGFVTYYNETRPHRLAGA